MNRGLEGVRGREFANVAGSNPQSAQSAIRAILGYLSARGQLNSELRRTSPLLPLPSASPSQARFWA
eukprot:4735248-Alexandrium_andersonii.AAC.1